MKLKVALTGKLMTQLVVTQLMVTQLVVTQLVVTQLVVTQLVVAQLVIVMNSLVQEKTRNMKVMTEVCLYLHCCVVSVDSSILHISY